MNLKKVLMSVFVFGTLFSCSTLMNGPKQNFRIVSESKKEIAVYDGRGNLIKKGENGELNISLARAEDFFRGANYTIKAGDETKYIESELDILPFIGGNFLISIGWGLFIDIYTGSQYKLLVDGQRTSLVKLK